MIIVDELELTYGTLDMIGQDLKIEGNSLYDDDYADKVVEQCSISNYVEDEVEELYNFILQINDDDDGVEVNREILKGIVERAILYEKLWESK